MSSFTVAVKSIQGSLSYVGVFATKLEAFGTAMEEHVATCRPVVILLGGEVVLWLGA